MSHVLWSDVEKGLKTETMRRTIQILKWLSEGHTLQFANRTIAMCERVGGGPYLILKASHHVGTEEKEPVALGMDPDLGILHSFVKSLSDEEFTVMATNATLTDSNRDKSTRKA